MNFDTVFSFYSQNHLSKIRPKGNELHNFESVYENYLALLVGGWDVATLTVEQCEKFFESLRHRLDFATFNRCLKSFRGAINHGLRNIENFPLKVNPASKIKKMDERTRDRILNDDECVKLVLAFNALRHHTYTDMFKMLLYTGARVGAIQKMEWCEIDFEEKYWLAKTRGNAKDSHYRHDLNDDAIALLQSRARISNEDDIYVFPATNDSSKPAHPGDDYWKCAIIDADLYAEGGVERLRKQDLRRSYSVSHLINSDSVVVTSMQIGHNYPRNMDQNIIKLSSNKRT